MTKISTQINDLKNSSFGNLNNILINGNFDFWQRNATFSPATANAYTADRWNYKRNNSTATVNITRDTDVPTMAQSGFQSRYSLLITQTSTTDGSVDATDVIGLQQTIEGYNYQPVHGTKGILQFWIKASITGNYPVALVGASTRSYVTYVTVNAANTWELKTINVNFDTAAGYGTDHTSGLLVFIGWMVGSTFQTATQNSWVAGEFYAPSGVTLVNMSATNGATLRLSQVMMASGVYNQVPVFRRAGSSFGDEYRLCQRYYEKSYNLDVPPGANPDDIGAEWWSPGSGSNVALAVRFKVSKRIAPTTTIYTHLGVSGNVRDVSAGANRAATTDLQGHNGFRIMVPSTTAGNNHLAHWTADSEL